MDQGNLLSSSTPAWKWLVGEDPIELRAERLEGYLFVQPQNENAPVRQRLQ
jgi:hypothetical protein